MTHVVVLTPPPPLLWNGGGGGGRPPGCDGEGSAPACSPGGAASGCGCGPPGQGLRYAATRTRQGLPSSRQRSWTDAGAGPSAWQPSKTGVVAQPATAATA